MTAPSRTPRDRFRDLAIEQGVVLWSVRMLVIERKRGVDVTTDIEPVLDSLGLSATLAPIRNLVAALSQGCTRFIDIRCVCAPTIGPDERALLDMLALAQAMRPFEALLLLRGFVTQAGAEAALRHADAVGTVLAQAGRVLPEPEQPVRHFALIPGTTPALAACRTLH